MYVELAQWEAAREMETQQTTERSAPSKPVALAKPQATEKKRLTWNEQRELAGMEAAILVAETRVQSLQAVVSDPAVLADHVKSREAFAQLADAQHQVETLYARWSDLESKK